MRRSVVKGELCGIKRKAGRMRLQQTTLADAFKKRFQRQYGLLTREAKLDGQIPVKAIGTIAARNEPNCHPLSRRPGSHQRSPGLVEPFSPNGGIAQI